MRALLFDDIGQDLIEYGLLAALISVAAVAAVAGLGVAIDTYYQTDVNAKIP